MQSVVTPRPGIHFVTPASHTPRTPHLITDHGPLAGAGTGAAGESGFVPEPGPTDQLFDPDRLLRVEIEMAPEDWDALRTQTRSIFDLIGSSCLEEPPPRPFTYFPATVTVDGK